LLRHESGIGKRSSAPDQAHLPRLCAISKSGAQAFDARAEESGTIDIIKKLAFSPIAWGTRTGACLQFHTANEIELWMAHIAPRMNKPVQYIEVGLRNWHCAMAERGLTDAHSTAVEQFVRRPSRLSS
jgi:hypothetical protein